MPNLENLRKQAKQFLRWHRQRHYPVASMIGSLLPRFRHLRDNEILDASFKLSDAQELVARRSGFENWEALTKAVQTMTDASESNQPAPRLVFAEPQLFVSDIVAACAFYTRKLGFTVNFVYGEPPFYGQVARDGVRLNLRHADPLPFDNDLRAKEDLLSATIIVDNIKPLFLEFQGRDADFHQKLRTEPWGARTFIVADPDGNLICFSTPADRG